jgi:subtilisin family serine protease
MIVVCSAGNEGARAWKYITAPADVNGVLAIGSVTTTGSRSSFSSFGPSADNRIKPDVVAFGSGTVVVTPTGSIGTASGTSLASPLVACLAAGLVQAYPSLTSQEIRDAIIKSGDQSFAPDNNKGYGIPNFEGAVNSLKTIRQTDYLAVYPNPVSSSTNYQLTISFKEPIADASIVLYDLLGRVVFSYSDAITWSKIPLTLDFSNQPTGVYILEIKSSKGNYTTKVVKSN